MGRGLNCGPGSTFAGMFEAFGEAVTGKPVGSYGSEHIADESIESCLGDLVLTQPSFT